MVDFIDEVNEDLRQQRFHSFWQKVGAYVIAASVVIVVATVGSVLWQNYAENRQIEAAEAFLAADKTARTQNFEAAAKEYVAVAERNAQGFSEMATMKSAYALTRAGNNAQAIETYRSVANNKGADKGIRSLARIYAALLMMQENAPAEEIDALLTPLAEDAANPFSSFAREQKAHIALNQGDSKQAHSILAALASDMKAPASLRRRAQAQLATLGEQMDAAAEDAAAAQETAE